MRRIDDATAAKQFTDRLPAGTVVGVQGMLTGEPAVRAQFQGLALSGASDGAIFVQGEPAGWPDRGLWPWAGNHPGDARPLSPPHDRRRPTRV